MAWHFLDPTESGSHRPRNWAKYFKGFGLEPIVLTHQTDSSVPPEADVEVIEAEGVNVNAMVRRIAPHSLITKGNQESTRQPGTSFQGLSSTLTKIGKFLWDEVVNYPDQYRLWASKALRALDSWGESETLDAVITSGPPHSLQLLGKQISRQLGIPWIADYRDLWTTYHYYQHSKLRKLFEERLERRTTGFADCVVAVTPAFRDNLIQHLGKQRVELIPNGFDPAWLRINPPERTRKEFRLLHPGNLLGGRRDPAPILKVIADLIDTGEIDETRLRFDFIGEVSSEIANLISDMGCEPWVHQLGRRAHQDVLAAERAADILVLLTWDHPDERGVVPGKLYEYLAAKRPILGIGGADGHAKHIIESTKAGKFCQSESEIQRFVLQRYQEYLSKGRAAYEGDEEKIQRYSHRSLASKYVSLLENLIHSQKQRQGNSESIDG